MRKGWPGTTAALCFCVANGLEGSFLAFASGVVPVLVLVVGVVVTAGEFVTAGVLVTVGLSEIVD